MAPPSSPADATALAVTLGDPRGIGPEVAFRAAQTLAEDDPEARLVFVVPEGITVPSSLPYPVHPVPAWDGSEKDAGRAAAQSIEHAVGLAGEGRVGGIVTAPLHKPALQAAGWDVPGQTEMLQRLSGAATVGMLMAAEKTRLGGALRVLLATTHIPLREVAQRVTEDLLVAQCRVLWQALRWDWALDAPRVALCGLNPHASDQGLFGDEEERVFVPAVERLRAEGMDVSGPLPADTVFGRALGGAFDAVVAPYHDVGMAAFKTAAFGTGVNVTLGLPFVRTSPDHGTAFDLAGHPGRADPASMVEALRLARTLVRRRFDTGRADV
ncbi:MAG TPA: 4-hydroxythreonine-4-phosphate dehydrogenase PdxA [Longimicrobiales bacterium]|nr:4-hydroxythreonine-4-phosphate dehydrogenase PdxA [Longimicrobiales bacterium]